MIEDKPKKYSGLTKDNYFIESDSIEHFNIQDLQWFGVTETMSREEVDKRFNRLYSLPLDYKPMKTKEPDNEQYPEYCPHFDRDVPCSQCIENVNNSMNTKETGELLKEALQNEETMKEVIRLATEAQRSVLDTKEKLSKEIRKWIRDYWYSLQDESETFLPEKKRVELEHCIRYFIRETREQAVKSKINKEHFQANMLDGDKVEDCGGAMLSAKSVWEYIQSLSE